MKNFDPSADLQVPDELEIRRSEADAARHGVWCKNDIKEGKRFGPFVGEKALEYKEHMDPSSMWEIVDVETKEFLFYIDGTNPRQCNWMRCVSSVSSEESAAGVNLVAEQDGIDIYYRTLRDIGKGAELLLAAENLLGKKRRSKQRSLLEIRRANITSSPSDTSPTKSEEATEEKREDAVSQRGRKRSARKYWTMELVTDEPSQTKEEKPLGKLRRKEKQAAEMPAAAEPKPESSKSSGTVSVMKSPLDDDESSGDFFRFELSSLHQGKNRSGRKVFHCDICAGVYRHGFSLKRHYLRAHINGKYISKLDAVNCGVNMKGSVKTDVDHPEADEDDDDDDADTIASEQSQIETGSDKVAVTADKNSKSAQDLNDEAVSVSSDHSQSVRSASKILLADRGDSGAGKGEGEEHESSVTDQAEEELRSQTLNLEVEEIQDTSPQGSSQSSRDGLTMDVEEYAGSRTVGRALKGLYRCNVCGAVFDMSKELKDHLTKHPVAANDLKFSCEHCPMKFKHRQNLLRHEVVHSGAKTFSCNYCDKRFPTLTNQRRHERIHRGQRLVCSLCPSTFTQTGDLKKHMRKLHPETYQECAYCAKYYTSETALAVHLHKAHGKDSDSNRKQISARRNARKHSLEVDQAESRRLAGCEAATLPAVAGSSQTQLEYACTICLKKFLDYANMCRHRRLAHGRGAPRLPSEGVRLSNADDEEYSSTDEVDGSTAAATWDRIDAQQLFFARVSRNIANNLQNHMEGKAEQVRNASVLVKWRHMPSLNNTAKNDAVKADKSETESSMKAEDIKLENFNFPPGFCLSDERKFYAIDSIASEQIKSKEFSSLLSKSYTTIIPCKAGTGKYHDSAVKDLAKQTTTVTEAIETKHSEVLESSVVEGPNAADTEMESMTVINSQVSDTSGVDCSSGLVMDLTTHDPTQSPNADDPVDLSSNLKIKSEVDGVICRDTKNSACSKFLQLPGVQNVGKSAVDIVRESRAGRKCVCLVCFHEFSSQYELFCHQSERHANIDCRHVEVDPSFNALWCRKPNPMGLLNVSSNRLPKEIVAASTTACTVQCTKCGKACASSSVLHQHIAECGDYWRSLNTRVRWIFVLRGNQVPSEEKPSKKRGKFQWGSSNDSARRQPLHRSSVTPTDQTSPGRRAGRMFGRTRSTESLVDEDDPTKKHRNPYSPWKHARRRREAELMDVEKCRGCGEVFETILQLERHIPSCAEKQRLIELHAAEDGDDSDDNDDFDPNKHLCIYCERQFTYLRTLRKHVLETCAARKTLVDQGEYLDAEWENDLTAKVTAAVGGVPAVNSIGGVSRDLSASFNEAAAAPDEADTADSKRGGRYRRRRGNNWGYRGKPRKVPMESSRKLSQESGDSLFDWEDAFLSNWAQEERNISLQAAQQFQSQQAQSKSDARAGGSAASKTSVGKGDLLGNCSATVKPVEKTVSSVAKDCVQAKADSLKQDHVGVETSGAAMNLDAACETDNNKSLDYDNLLAENDTVADVSEKALLVDECSDEKQHPVTDKASTECVNTGTQSPIGSSLTLPMAAAVECKDLKNSAKVIGGGSSHKQSDLEGEEELVSSSVGLQAADSSCSIVDSSNSAAEKILAEEDLTARTSNEVFATKEKLLEHLGDVIFCAKDKFDTLDQGKNGGLENELESTEVCKQGKSDVDVAAASSGEISIAVDSSSTNDVEADSSVSNENEADSSLGSNEVEDCNQGSESGEVQAKRRKRKRARLTMTKRRKPISS